MDIQGTIEYRYIRIRKRHTTFRQSHYEQSMLMGEKVTWVLEQFGDDGQWYDVTELCWIHQVQDIKWLGDDILACWRSPASSMVETVVADEFHGILNEFEARTGTTTTYLAPPATRK